MSAKVETDVSQERVARIRELFGRYVPMCYEGLPSMLLEGGHVFCFRALKSPTGLELEGQDERYSTMVAIGAGAQEKLGRITDTFHLEPILDHLADWAPTAPELGDSGLVLWSLLLHGDARAEDLAGAIVGRKAEVFQSKYLFASMEMGYLLIGLSEALRAGVGGEAVKLFASDLAERLRENQRPETDLFTFNRYVFRKNLHKLRIGTRLGSFASNVYPTIGFSFYARASGNEEARDVAARCARRLCELQGPEGQWWWVYQTRRPVPAVKFPVYGIHQDAMGPMALMAAAISDGCHDRYDAAVHKSLAWFENRPECGASEMVDVERGVVWRAVQHDDPATTGRLGLGPSELSRMGRVAWFGSEDERPIQRSYVCPECRPYHLGWILLGAALFEECVAGR